MAAHIIIAGAGIGGLSVALACAKAGHTVQIAEQAAELSAVGAGIQLGPNAVRWLESWGLGDALRHVASFPERLEVHDAASGALLGQLTLGDTARRRYGHAYATIRRADMQALLLEAVRVVPQIALQLGASTSSFEMTGRNVILRGANVLMEGDALIGADGLWSRVRAQLLGDGAPRRPGHIAFRTLIDAKDVPEGIARDAVHAWLGVRMHAVAYPVCAGKAFNLVIITDNPGFAGVVDAPNPWSGPIDSKTVLESLSNGDLLLQKLQQAAPAWTYWMLHDREPVSAPLQLARGRVALAGDAAHPLRPYLAQGAVMAIEDAAELARQLNGCEAAGVPAALQAYANVRWQRVRRVQQRSARNGTIFHAEGLMRVGRDLSMRLLGERLLDVPWLYRGTR